MIKKKNNNFIIIVYSSAAGYGSFSASFSASVPFSILPRSSHASILPLWSVSTSQSEHLQYPGAGQKRRLADRLIRSCFLFLLLPPPFSLSSPLLSTSTLSPTLCHHRVFFPHQRDNTRKRERKREIQHEHCSQQE